MAYLFTASLLWAFSFGLIGHVLAGVPPCFVVLVRLMLSCLVFSPYMRSSELYRKLRFELVLVGAIQYGLMYLFYQLSFSFLPSHMVALFTVMTPLYVSCIYDAHRRRFHSVFLLSAFLAVCGAAVIRGVRGDLAGALVGFGLVQVSNLCFAFGQVRYKMLLAGRPGVRDHQVFSLLYAGAVAAALVPGLLDMRAGVCLTGQQWLTIVYLGVVPSGVAFYLWNAGARRVNAGVLAVFNNLKIPLAISVSVLLFRETADVTGLVVGTVVLLAAFLLARRGEENPPRKA